MPHTRTVVGTARLQQLQQQRGLARGAPFQHKRPLSPLALCTGARAAAAALLDDNNNLTSQHHHH